VDVWHVACSTQSTEGVAYYLGDPFSTQESIECWGVSPALYVASPLQLPRNLRRFADREGTPRPVRSVRLIAQAGVFFPLI
jgi:hypothetical protein